MSTADRDKLPENFQPQKRSTGMTCLIGCLGTLFVLALVCGGVGLWSYYYLPGIAAGKVRDMIVQGIDQSELPAADKEQVKAQVNRVVEAYQSGKINSEKLMKVLQEVAESPVMGSAVLYGIEEKYVKPSGLSDEEKQAASLTLQRVLRGVVEEKIHTSDLEGAMSPLMEGSGDNKTLKEKITDEELRQFIAALKTHADEAGIPEEPYRVSIGEEIKKAVDTALGEAPQVEAAP